MCVCVCVFSGLGSRVWCFNALHDYRKTITQVWTAPIVSGVFEPVQAKPRNRFEFVGASQVQHPVPRWGGFKGGYLEVPCGPNIGFRVHGLGFREHNIVNPNINTTTISMSRFRFQAQG